MPRPLHPVDSRPNARLQLMPPRAQLYLARQPSSCGKASYPRRAHAYGGQDRICEA